MKVAVFSDIHSNLPALKKVIAHAQAQGVNAFIGWGDQIGYLPEPVEVLNALYTLQQSSRLWWITGNHEKYWQNISKLIENNVLIDNLGKKRIRELWSQICEQWASPHRAQANHGIKEITKDICQRWGGAAVDFAIDSLLRNMAEMETRPDQAVEWYQKEVFQNQVHEGPQEIPWNQSIRLVAVHASLNNPTGDYVEPENSDEMKFMQINKLLHNYPSDLPLCLCYGHTHKPAFVPLNSYHPEDVIQATAVTYEKPMEFGQKITVINPGSVGYPRDDDPWASYAIIQTPSGSTPTVTFHRVQVFNSPQENDLIEKMRKSNYDKRLRAQWCAAK